MPNVREQKINNPKMQHWAANTHSKRLEQRAEGCTKKNVISKIENFITEFDIKVPPKSEHFINITAKSRKETNTNINNHENSKTLRLNLSLLELRARNYMGELEILKNSL